MPGKAYSLPQDKEIITGRPNPVLTTYAKGIAVPPGCYTVVEYLHTKELESKDVCPDVLPFVAGCR